MIHDIPTVSTLNFVLHWHSVVGELSKYPVGQAQVVSTLELLRPVEP